MTPIMHLIVKKFDDMMNLEAEVDKLKQELASKHPEEECAELADHLVELQQKVAEQASIVQAWSHFPKDQQWEMMKAADYTDGWFHIEKHRVSFRVFYFCNGKNVPGGCATIQSSATWARKHQDPLAPKQVWYCRVCGCSYKTTMGVMLEMRRGDQSFYMKAAFPPDDIQDNKKAKTKKNKKQKQKQRKTKTKTKPKKPPKKKSEQTENI